MYLPSNTPILTDQRADAVRLNLAIEAQLLCGRKQAARDRMALFNTLISPQQAQDIFGTGTAIDIAKVQAQTETSRASAILGGVAAGLDGGGPSIAQIIAGAPEVVSLNRGGGCQKAASFVRPPLGPDPVPLMPHRAPVIVQGPAGPLHFTGAPQSDQPVTQPYVAQPTPTQPLPIVHWGPATSQSAPLAVSQYYKILNTGGLTGYAPPWSDAEVSSGAAVDPGVGGWLMNNPWTVLALAAAGVYALSRRSR